MIHIKKIIFSVVLSIGCAFLSTPVFAVDINGDYKSNDELVLRVIALDYNQGSTTDAAAQIIVSSGGCSGDVSGVGKVVGNIFKFNAYTTITSRCSITVKFDKDGASGVISEQGCSDWHGVQCSFEGRVSK